MKKSKSYKNIIIKTTAAFLSFYFVMMAVITCVHADNVRKNMRYKTQFEINKMEEILDDATNYSYYKSINSFPENTTESYEVFKLYQKLESVMINLAGENIYIRLTIYDNNNNIIAKSGNVLFFSGNYGYSHNKCIPLNEFMSRDEINELFSINNLWALETIQITGYDYDKYVIPEKIKVFDDKHDDNLYKEKIFNIKDNEGLIKTEYIKDYTTLYFERTDDNGPITDSMSKRYSYCDELARPSLEYWQTEGTFLNKQKKDNIIKGEYGYVLGKSLCYINYGYVYYPLEVALPQLIPIYILCFIFVLLLIFILSNKMVRVFYKQQKLEQNRKDLTNAIAYELKTPLGIIRSYSEGLKENINIDKKDYYLDVIVDETEKMDKMVIEMLNLSKLEANAYELKLETFSLVELTQKEIDKHKSLYNHKGLNIIFNYDNNHEVKADKKGFEYVISNFISNALKHTPNEMNIIINIENSNNKIVFSIENQGDKISEEKLPRIWDSFYKAVESRERKDGGTGLGLTIAKNYLVLHKAQYGCENTENGVKFWFKI
ncbi:MAG: hypothetical protein A2Y15_05360 [Clostridiales bacterium GWF2_36_10]|nr:MAG: hypothetical protein A2Y15_05360 [Clostridiales bacterium GWF2_36_10]HAN20092.1 hypothetical protein [Clostridiales bacterium]